MCQPPTESVFDDEGSMVDTVSPMKSKKSLMSPPPYALLSKHDSTMDLGHQFNINQSL
jgi:hypothetical protein